VEKGCRLSGVSPLNGGIDNDDDRKGPLLFMVFSGARFRECCCGVRMKSRKVVYAVISNLVVVAVISTEVSERTQSGSGWSAVSNISGNEFALKSDRVTRPRLLRK
jgi:hypothetical protein